MDAIITLVLDEMISVIDSLKSGKALAAYGMYLDWVGDVNKLSRRDYSAACDLLWRGIDDAGFELACADDLRQHAGFQLAW